MLVKSESISTTLGLAGLFLFAIFGWIDRVNNDIALSLMLIAALIQYKSTWRVMRHEPLSYIFLIFAIYIILHAYLSGQTLPHTQDAQWEAVGKWLRLWFFLLIAWWMDGNTRRIFWVLALAYFGFSLQTIWAFEWNNLSTIANNTRLRLGLNQNASTLIAGIGLIALFVYLPCIIEKKFRLGIKLGLILFLYLISCAFLIEVMLLTQSRAAWFATIITLAGMLPIYVFRNRQLLRKQNFVVTCIVILSGSLVIFSINSDRITQRLYQESALAQSITYELDIDKIPYSSAGRRIHAWHLGIHRFFEKPVFGWGPGTSVTRDVTGRSYGHTKQYNIDRKVKTLSHLHNTYLIMLVRLGAFGTLIILLAFVVINYNIIREHHNYDMDRQIYLFYIASIIAFLIANFAIFRLFTQEDQTLIYLILGSAYSYRLARLKRQYPVQL